MLNSWLPITRIKIFGAKILYKITTFFVGKEKRIITRDGIDYEIDLSEGIELSLFLFGRFQSHITKNSFINIKPNDIIFDIGANVGLMSLPFAKLVPNGMVYSFEPTNYALERLKKNISLNNSLSKNIRVINSFVSMSTSENPTITAFSSWKVNGEKDPNNHPVHLGTPKEAINVPSTTLDDFVLNNNINQLNFIKIDTDGHEYEVFKGGYETIKKFRPAIIFEIGLYVMQEKNISFSYYLDYFGSLNYKLLDTKTEKLITKDNYTKLIPKNGSTDLFALPQ